MKIESASCSGAEISGENSDVYKLGTYSYRNTKDREIKQYKDKKKPPSKSIQCYNCGNNVNGSIIKHKSSCPARNSKCYNCQITGHFTKFCKSKDIKKIEQSDSENQQNTDEIYNINLFRTTTSSNRSNQ